MRRMAALIALSLAQPGAAVAGDLLGVARLAGSPPPPAVLEVTKDRATCGDEVPDEAVSASGGLLRNVVVVVKGGPRPAPGKVTLDQRKCRYVPHVQAAALGSTLEVVNGDPLLHNVHGYIGQSTAFNVAMPTMNQGVPRKLDKPGIVGVRCDVHAWMSAYVVVTDSPFAVTGPDGTFSLRGLPPGSYAVTAWHERLGEKTATVAVPASGSVSVDFTFTR